MQRVFGFAGPLPNWPPRYNVAPTQAVPVVHAGEGGARRMTAMRWGLIPSWSREGPKAKPLINARAETVERLNSFRAAFKRRRCLMPADGFYEWYRPEQGPKQPYNFVRAEGGPFAIAAIWEMWQDGQGAEVPSVAMITTEANATMAPIHNRMPVILPEQAWTDWLSPGPDAPAGTGEMPEDVKAAKALLRSAPDDFLKAYPVSTRVNAVRNDDESLIAPADPAGPTTAAPAPPQKPRDEPGEAPSSGGQLNLF